MTEMNNRHLHNNNVYNLHDSQNIALLTNVVLQRPTKIIPKLSCCNL
jgi:hypothetical protein